MLGLQTFFRRETTALSVEDDTVRLAGVVGEKVARWGSASLPEGVVVRGQVRNPAALAEVVKKLVAAHQASRNRVVLGIAGVGTASRLAPLDADGSAMTDEAAREIAARWLPVDKGQLAWQIVEKNGRQHLFMLVIPRVTMESYLTALQQADIQPVAVDLKPLALIRAAGQQNAVLVDLERMLMTLVIVDGALPQRVRVLPLDFPSVSTTGDKIVRLVEELQELIIARNLELSQGGDKQTGMHIHAAVPFWLSGSLADQPMLLAVLREAMEHPCLIAPAPFDCPDDLPVAQYLTCFGLAMKRF